MTRRQCIPARLNQCVNHNPRLIFKAWLVFKARLLFEEIWYINDAAPPIGQRLGVEAEYRPTDEGQGRDGLIFDARHRCLFSLLN